MNPVQSALAGVVLPLQKLLYEVFLNNQDTEAISLFLKDTQNNLYVDANTINSWGLMMPTETPMRYLDRDFYNLAEYKGYTHEVNPQALTINLNFPGKYFSASNLTLKNNQLNPPDKSPIGGYLNYNLYSTGPLTHTNISTQVQSSGLFAGTLFGPFGNINTEYLLTNGASNPGSNNPIRIQSFYQLDFPNKMETLIIGDSTTTPGSWGQAVAFGGISWQSNFGTQPNYTTYPLPVATGVASVPTSIQLYANNMLISNQRITPGPFTIDNIPVVNGAGTLNVASTNVLGQQVVTLIPYYVSSSLLKPGLQNFSYQLGFVRENYGINSNLYGPLIGIVSDAVGVTNHLTLEGDVQAMLDQQNYGGGFAYSLFDYLILSGAFAGSQNPLGNGVLVQIGVEHQAMRGISYGGTVILTSPKYLQIAMPTNNPSPSTQIQAFMGSTLFKIYSAGLSFTEINNRNAQGSMNFISVNLSRNISKLMTLTLSGLTNVTGVENHSLSLVLNMAFDTHYNLNFNDTDQGSMMGMPGYNQLITTFNKTLPQGPGYGYQLQTTNYSKNYQGQHPDDYQGTYALNTDNVNVSASVANQGQLTSYQASANGAITYLDRGLYLSPQVQGSFALAEIPELANTPIYYNNQLVGKTNANGNIIIPNLQPYTDNKITINPVQIPLDERIGATQMHTTPYAKQGVIVKFPISKIHPASFSLVQTNGSYVPVGTIVNLNDNSKDYYVGYEGKVYVPELPQGVNKLKAIWDKGSCETTITIHGDEHAKGYIKRLGTLVCQTADQ